MSRLALFLSFLTLLVFASPNVEAQSLTKAEKRFLGKDAGRYLNAYRYPQKKLSARSYTPKTSPNSVTSNYLSKPTNFTESSLTTILPELPSIQRIELPSSAPKADPASTMLSDSDLFGVSNLEKAKTSTEKAVVTVAKKEAAKISPVTQAVVKTTEALPASKDMVTNDAAAVTSEPLIATTEEASPKPPTAISESVPQDAEKIEELRTLIEQLRAARQKMGK